MTTTQPITTTVNGVRLPLNDAAKRSTRKASITATWGSGEQTTVTVDDRLTTLLEQVDSRTSRSMDFQARLDYANECGTQAAQNIERLNQEKI